MITLERLEMAEAEAPPAAPAGGLWVRRRWLVAALVFAAWVLWQSWWTRRPVINTRGWSQVERFGRAALAPRLDGEFLAVVTRAAVTSLEYAVLGTALAMVIGISGGLLTCAAFGPAPGARASRLARGRRALLRLLISIPRGIHEAVWALGLVFVLGRDPLVAVFAIGIPFGAITAQVVSDALDSADQAPVDALRSMGTGRLVSVMYGLMPRVAGDLAAYGFYRVECALRSSIVLGAIGVGGIGFELALSFHSLRYEEMWTLIYTLVGLSFVVDVLGERTRRRRRAPRPSVRRLPTLAALSLVVVGLAAWHVGVRPSTLWSPRTRSLAGRLGEQAWPPRLPPGGWSRLADDGLATIQLSAVAIAVAVCFGVPLASIAARPAPGGGPVRRACATAVRVFALLIRSVPPTVWALIVLFVIYPGPLAGGLALGLYTAGVLIRLNADIIEHADLRPRAALLASGASPISASAYGLMPILTPRLVAVASYRWEVAARETVIVGLVGAAGLGRLLGEQNAAQNEAGMLTAVFGLIVVSAAIETVSRRARAAFG